MLRRLPILPSAWLLLGMAAPAQRVQGLGQQLGALPEDLPLASGKRSLALLKLHSCLDVQRTACRASLQPCRRGCSRRIHQPSAPLQLTASILPTRKLLAPCRLLAFPLTRFLWLPQAWMLLCFSR